MKKIMPLVVAGMALSAGIPAFCGQTQITPKFVTSSGKIIDDENYIRHDFWQMLGRRLALGMRTAPRAHAAASTRPAGGDSFVAATGGGTKSRQASGGEARGSSRASERRQSASARESRSSSSRSSRSSGESRSSRGRSSEREGRSKSSRTKSHTRR